MKFPRLSSAIAMGLIVFPLFALFPAGLLLTVLVAAAIPARRASRIHPMQALREE